jgi:hypothetical protein
MTSPRPAHNRPLDLNEFGCGQALRDRGLPAVEAKTRAKFRAQLKRLEPTGTIGEATTS